MASPNRARISGGGGPLPGRFQSHENEMKRGVSFLQQTFHRAGQRDPSPADPHTFLFLFFAVSARHQCPFGERAVGGRCVSSCSCLSFGLWHRMVRARPRGSGSIAPFHRSTAVPVYGMCAFDGTRKGLSLSREVVLARSCSVLFVRAGTGIVPPVVVWARTVPIKMDGHGFSFERLLVLNCDEARTAATAGCGARNRWACGVG